MLTQANARSAGAARPKATDMTDMKKLGSMEAGALLGDLGPGEDDGMFPSRAEGEVASAPTTVQFLSLKGPM